MKLSSISNAFFRSYSYYVEPIPKTVITFCTSLTAQTTLRLKTISLLTAGTICIVLIYKAFHRSIPKSPTPATPGEDTGTPDPLSTTNPSSSPTFTAPGEDTGTLDLPPSTNLLPLLTQNLDPNVLLLRELKKALNQFPLSENERNCLNPYLNETNLEKNKEIRIPTGRVWFVIMHALYEVRTKLTDEVLKSANKLIHSDLHKEFLFFKGYHQSFLLLTSGKNPVINERGLQIPIVDSLENHKDEIPPFLLVGMGLYYYKQGKEKIKKAAELYQLGMSRMNKDFEVYEKHQALLKFDKIKKWIQNAEDSIKTSNGIKRAWKIAKISAEKNQQAVSDDYDPRWLIFLSREVTSENTFLINELDEIQSHILNTLSADTRFKPRSI